MMKLTKDRLLFFMIGVLLSQSIYHNHFTDHGAPRPTVTVLDAAWGAHSVLEPAPAPAPRLNPEPIPVVPDIVVDNDTPALSAYQLSLLETDGWEFTREQGVLLARIWVSEVGKMLRPVERGGTSGAPTLECHLIGHVVRNHKGKMLVKETREPAIGWIAIMQELSSGVTGKHPPKEGSRQEWTSTLPATGKEQPSGWVTERDGDWSLYADHWALIREVAVIVWTTQRLKPVPGGGKPMGWDMAGVESTRKRLCKLRAGDPNDADGVLGTGNWFWGFNGDPACIADEPEIAATEVAEGVGG